MNHFSRFKNHHHRSLSLDHDSPHSPSPSTPNSIEASSPSAAEAEVEGEEAGGESSPDELAIIPTTTLRHGSSRRTKVGLGRNEQEKSLRGKTKLVGGRRIGSTSTTRTGGSKVRVLTRRERKMEEKERGRDRPPSGSCSGNGGKEVEMLKTLFI